MKGHNSYLTQFTHLQPQDTPSKHQLLCKVWRILVKNAQDRNFQSKHQQKAITFYLFDVQSQTTPSHYSTLIQSLKKLGKMAQAGEQKRL